MIYVVKCFYCEHEFKVKRGETGADMMCPECGTANNIKDVTRRIEEENDKVDSDMQAIKDFDMDEHPVSVAVGWVDEKKRKRKSIIHSIEIVVILALFLLYKFGLVDFGAIMEKLEGLFELQK